MLFVPNVTVAKMQQRVLITQLEESYDFADSPHWLKELMASFLTGTVFGGEKTKEVAAIINAQLTDVQLTDWRERLQALEGKKISGELLDKELSGVLGASTKYISMNAQSEKSYPFLYNDPRILYVNSEKQPAVQVILKDGEILYGADLLLESIGYDVSIGEHGYYVVSETREFRFPNEPGFYVFNQRRYDTVSLPVKLVAGQYFIEESWLKRLFIVEIEKTENRINISAP